MNSLGFVALIVLIGCATGVAYEWMRLRNEKGKNDGDDDLVARINTLEDRIRVLERIVTEKKFDLKKEIDSL
jgi:hypothetical protein